MELLINRRSFLLAPAAVCAPSLAYSSEGPITRPLQDAVRLSEHGAALDGTTDDSAALQGAIDACLAERWARSLIVDGPCRLERPVQVDRPVDRSEGIFRIIGSDSSGRLIAAGGFSLIDSRLHHPKEPQSEHIWFEGLRFESATVSTTASVISDKFLRVRFNDCEFHGIRALNGAKYAQEWHFSRCLALRWTGPFFTSHGGYHIVSRESKYQNGGGTVFSIADPTLRNAGCVGCSFHQDISESNNGSFVDAAVVRGLSVAGLYSEGNHGPTLDFQKNALNQGISVSGSMFAPKIENNANANFYDILWGRIAAGSSSGNYSSGRLHKAVTPEHLSIQGDYAALRLSYSQNGG